MTEKRKEIRDDQPKIRYAFQRNANWRKRKLQSFGANPAGEEGVKEEVFSAIAVQNIL